MTTIKGNWTFLAIDPGLSGGLVLLSDDDKIIEASAMPDSTRGIFELLEEWNGRYHLKCAIEKQQARPGDGAASIATFFEHYGVLKTCLVLLEIPHVFITAKKWQNAMLLKRPSSYSYDKWKRRLRDHAKSMYPGDKRVTMKTADAIILAHYYRKNY